MHEMHGCTGYTHVYAGCMYVQDAKYIEILKKKAGKRQQSQIRRGNDKTATQTRNALPEPPCDIFFSARPVIYSPYTKKQN